VFERERERRRKEKREKRREEKRVLIACEEERVLCVWKKIRGRNGSDHLSCGNFNCKVMYKHSS